MKTFLAFLLLLGLSLASIGGRITVKMFEPGLQECSPDSGAGRGTYHNIYTIGPFPAWDCLFGSDTLLARTWGNSDSVYVAWAADIWARDRLPYYRHARDSVRILWSSSAIAPSDTSRGISGHYFISADTTIGGTVGASNSPTAITLLQLYGIHWVVGKIYDIPAYMFIEVIQIDSSATAYHLDSTFNTVYSNVRFFKP